MAQKTLRVEQIGSPIRREGDQRATLIGLKLLGVGELTTKLTFEVTRASKSAIEGVEKAGGSVNVTYGDNVSTRGKPARVVA